MHRSIYQKFESCSSVKDSNGHEVFDKVLIRKAYEEDFKSRLSAHILVKYILRSICVDYMSFMDGPTSFMVTPRPQPTPIIENYMLSNI